MASYKLKCVPFHGSEFPVVLQNENGPCPLIAAANVLILRGHLKVPKAPDISQDRLMALVAEHLLDTNLSVAESSMYAADLRQNLQDVISILPKMATGVDVNPRFDSTRGFEFTNEMAIFDLMNINVVHGWLFDPKSRRYARVLKNQSYNQVVSRLVAIMGEQMPKHLLTTQNSMNSRTGSFSDMMQRGAVAEGSGVRQDDMLVSEEKGGSVGQLPTSMASEELISFEDDAVMLTGPLYLDRESQCGSGAKSGSDGEGEGGETVQDLIDELVASVAERKGAEKGAGPDGLGSSKGKVSTEGGGTFPRFDGVVSATSRSGASKDDRDAKAAGQQSRLVQKQKGKLELEKEAEDAKFATIAQEFLESTSSQLTAYGLKQLHDGLNDNELAVFFRNNHFNTLYKYNGSLYILVTDQGYLSEEGLVWERLDDIDGDTQYVTCDFLPYTRPEPVIQATDEELDLQQALAESVKSFRPPSRATDDQQDGPTETSHTDGDADYALALQLQEQMLMEGESFPVAFQPQQQAAANAVAQQARGVDSVQPPAQQRQLGGRSGASPVQDPPSQETSQQQQPAERPAGAPAHHGVVRMWKSMKKLIKRS